MLLRRRPSFTIAVSGEISPLLNEEHASGSEQIKTVVAAAAATKAALVVTIVVVVVVAATYMANGPVIGASVDLYSPPLLRTPGGKVLMDTLYVIRSDPRGKKAKM